MEKISLNPFEWIRQGIFDSIIMEYIFYYRQIATLTLLVSYSFLLSAIVELCRVKELTFLNCN